MTLAPTLYDFQICLSHVDRAIDLPQLGLKVARHPSETVQRLWLRVLAYCWLWEERPSSAITSTSTVTARTSTAR